MKTLLVHNPKAGSKRPTADELMGAARASGLIPTYQSIKEKGRKAALQKKWDLVIAAGGDGTAPAERRRRVREWR